jgi:outer membrane lipoprotein-sorting protein
MSLPQTSREKCRWAAVVLLTCLLFLLPSGSVVAVERKDPAAWVRDAQQAYATVEDYVAILHRQERFDGHLLEKETILLKFKKPFKVYLRWVAPLHQGREVLYADGWNANRLMAHEGGVLGFITMNLDPQGFLAMRQSRYPVTDTGIGRLLEVLADKLARATAADELAIIGSDASAVYGRKTQRIEAALARRPGESHTRGRVIVHFDIENKLPIKIETYDGGGQLLEAYGYQGLRLNPGLTDADFDPANPSCNF